MVKNVNELRAWLMSLDETGLRSITDDQYRNENIWLALVETVRDRDITDFSALKNHIETCFKQCLELYETRFRVLFEAQANPEAAVESFKSEPPLVKVTAWSYLTRNGVEDLEFAKFLHKHLGPVLLASFYSNRSDYARMAQVLEQQRRG